MDNSWKEIITNRSSKLQLEMAELDSDKMNDYLHNYYLNKTAFIVYPGNNYEKHLDIIKANLNEKAILVCIAGASTAFDNICDFDIDQLDRTTDFLLNLAMNRVIGLGCRNIILVGWPGEVEFHLSEESHSGESHSGELVSEFLYGKYNVHLFSLDAMANSIEQITPNELAKVVNHRNIIVIYDQNIRSYYKANLVIYLIEMFEVFSITKLFLRNGLKIITVKDFDKYDLLKKLRSELHKLAHIQTNDKFDNYVLYGIHPHGFYSLNNIARTKILGQKMIVWLDDLHYFAHGELDVIQKKSTIQTHAKKYNHPIIFSHFIDHLITPSPNYFSNLGITEHAEKVKFLFYTLNPDHYNRINTNDYFNRQNKIILSGCIDGGYLTRTELNNLRLEDHNFAQLVDYLKKTGSPDTMGMAYYEILSKYKAAFVGHYAFPINFLLAKHIEVLMCGCLGFYERNPLLEQQLGLIEFVHYVPCTDSEGKLIRDHKFYTNWMNSESGYEIAKSGAAYVREKFGEKYLEEYIRFFNE